MFRNRGPLFLSAFREFSGAFLAVSIPTRDPTFPGHNHFNPRRTNLFSREVRVLRSRVKAVALDANTAMKARQKPGFVLRNHHGISTPWRSTDRALAARYCCNAGEWAGRRAGKL
jgi:hypothetical protein